MSHTQTVAPARRRTRRTVWAVPLGLGFVYGLYAGILHANQGASGAISALHGLVAGVVVAVICYVIGRRQADMSRELESTLYGVVFGAAVGYLCSVSGQTWLKASMLGLTVGLLMGISTYYALYARGR